MNGYVWNLDARCRGAWSTSEQSQRELSGLIFDSLRMQEVNMVGSYTKDLTQNCQNWGLGACPGQYGSIWSWATPLASTYYHWCDNKVGHSLFFTTSVYWEAWERGYTGVMFHMLYSSGDTASCMQFGLLYLSFPSLLLQSAGRICGSISLPHSGQPHETNSRGTT